MMKLKAYMIYNAGGLNRHEVVVEDEDGNTVYSHHTTYTDIRSAKRAVGIGAQWGHNIYDSLYGRGGWEIDWHDRVLYSPDPDAEMIEKSQKEIENGEFVDLSAEAVTEAMNRAVDEKTVDALIESQEKAENEEFVDEALESMDVDSRAEIVDDRKETKKAGEGT